MRGEGSGVSDQLTAVSLTRKAIDAMDAGQVEDARALLAEALALNNAYEPAWLWLGYASRDDAERKYCFEQAVAANPDSQAVTPLATLKKIKAVPPPEIDAISDPPPPPDLTESHGSGKGGWWRWWMVIPALLLLVGLTWAVVTRYVTNDRLGSPVYIAVMSTGIDQDGTPGQEIVRSTQLFALRQNSLGGIAGHELVVVPYEDGGDADAARAVAEEIVADGRFSAVISPRGSALSLEVGPIFAEAGIPILTGTATSDNLTVGNPWFFRTTYPNHRQGIVMAAYAGKILGQKNAVIVEGPSEYSKSLADGIRDGIADTNLNMTPASQTTIEVTDEQESHIALIQQVRELDDPGVIFMTLQSESGVGLIVALREAGVKAPIICGDAMGSQGAINQLIEFEQKIGKPGAYTRDLYAAVPTAPDSLPSNALALRDAYLERFGTEPDWRAYTTFDAMAAASFAIETALQGNAFDDLAAVRTGARDALAALDSPEDALRGMLGPIYFDETQSTPNLITVETVVDDKYLVTAPTQLFLAPDSLNYSRQALIDAGMAVEISGSTLVVQQIVYTGINVVELNNLDAESGTFYADFFLWFLYNGDDSATDIVFNNAAEAGMGLGEPVTKTVTNGQTYALYRVAGDFKGNWIYYDFPFDHQVLGISFNHRSLPAPFVTYVIDSSMRELTTEQNLQSGIDETKSINLIPNWHPIDFTVYPSALGTSSNLGNPNIPEASRGITFSAFNTDVEMARDLQSFLIKNLLPLVLLAAVTYLSLFFSNDAMAERVSFGITGILTGAVLLTTVVDQLPSVSYTVAIEWVYYGFIMLSALTILVGMLGARYYEARNLVSLRRMNMFARIAYPVAIVGMIAWYWAKYA